MSIKKGGKGSEGRRVGGKPTARVYWQLPSCTLRRKEKNTSRKGNKISTREEENGLRLQHGRPGKNLASEFRNSKSRTRRTQNEAVNRVENRPVAVKGKGARGDTYKARGRREHEKQGFFSGGGYKRIAYHHDTIPRSA